MTGRIYLVLLAVASGALIALALFTYPAADDFCFQERAVRLGFLGAQADWYATWSGRYTATALVSGVMLAGQSWYSPALALVVLAWLISLWLLLSACAGNAFSRRDVALASLTLFVMYGAFAPGLNGAFYWASAAFTYQISSILLLLMLAMNIGVMRRGLPDRMTGALIAVVIANLILGIVLGGTNETILPLALLLLAVGAVVARRVSPRVAPAWLAGFAGVAIAVAIVVVAPGNEVRWQYFPEGRHLLHALPSTAIRTLGFIVRESANPALWLATALAAAPLWNFLPGTLRDWMTRRRGWLVLLALWLAMVAACFFPAEYAVGAGPPGRARNIAYAVFLLGWIPVVTVVAERFLRDRHPFVSPPRVKPLLLLALGLTLAASTQMRDIYKDLGNAPEYRRELARREVAIRQAAARGLGNLEVPQLAVETRHIYDSSIAQDNHCQAMVFGLESIQVRAVSSARQGH